MVSLPHLPSPTSSAHLSQAVYGVLEPLLLHTGPLTTDPALEVVWRATAALSAPLLLFFLVIGGGLGAGGDLLSDRILLPRTLVARLVLSLLLLLTSLAWTGWFISLSNHLIDGLAAGVALSPFAGSSGPVDILGWLFWVPLMVLGVLLAIISIVRIMELYVLIAVAPIANVLWLLPQTAPIARSWLLEFLVMTFVPFFQALVILLARAVTGALPLTGVQGDLNRFLAGLALLFLLIRIPGWLRRLVHGLPSAETGFSLFSLARILFF